jgi:hypothetical protein
MPAAGKCGWRSSADGTEAERRQARRQQAEAAALSSPPPPFRSLWTPASVSAWG